MKLNCMEMKSFLNKKGNEARKRTAFIITGTDRHMLLANFFALRYYLI